MSKVHASAGGQKSSLTARRPAWNGVYNGWQEGYLYVVLFSLLSDTTSNLYYLALE